jgi:transposase
MKVKQSIPVELRYTVMDFNAEFPTNDSCLEYIMDQRFPEGRAMCAKCKLERKHHRVTGRTAYACDHCGNHIYPLKGTIFEKTSTSLKIWFYAMYLMGSTRCGISAKQVQRETGVTYKTAWRIFNHIRSLLTDEPVKLEGKEVEVDEMYYGGKRKYSRGRPLRGDKKHLPVVAIVQRKGIVVAKAVKDVTGNSLLGVVRDHVAPGTTIYTDEFASYAGLSTMRTESGEPAKFQHHRIRHASGVYAMDKIHTNTIEGFWSLVKRGIGGVYHSVSGRYLQMYLDEYCFRYNRRHEGNQQFRAILERASRS